MPSPNEIDEAIMVVAGTRWEKVAMVIIMALESRSPEAGHLEAREIADRIEALIEQGRLQCQGDPMRWRHSEVRSPHLGPELRHYVATVAIVFPSLEPEGSNEFDLYEMDILFEAYSPEEALQVAIAISKASPTWRDLGYPEPAVLHAVRSIQHEYPGNRLPSWGDPQEWFPVSVAKIDRKALEQLRAGGDIKLRYGFVHVDGQ